MTNKVPSSGLEWTALILGGGLFCAAFAFGDVPPAALSAATAGLLVVTASTMALTRFRTSAEWSNVALGSWIVVAPYVLGFASNPTPLAVHLVIGLCVAAIAAMQLVAARNPAPSVTVIPARRRK